MALYSQEVCTHFFVKPRNKGWLNVNQSLTVCFSLFCLQCARKMFHTAVPPPTGLPQYNGRGEDERCQRRSWLLSVCICSVSPCVDSYDLLLRVKKKKRGKKKVWCVLICLVVFWGKYSSRWRVVLNLTLRLETGAFLEQHSEKQGTSETQSFSFLSKQCVREKPTA